MKSIIYQCGSEKSRIYEIVRLNGVLTCFCRLSLFLIILLICFDYYCYQCGCK